MPFLYLALTYLLTRSTVGALPWAYTSKAASIFCQVLGVSFIKVLVSLMYAALRALLISALSLLES